jgi:putative FmdB family regulatory protein
MPIYEYSCESCGNRFEKLVRGTSATATAVMEAGCPGCGDKHLRQEYSTFAARAGSGDYRPSPAESRMGESRGCGGGMCGTPGMCGMN